MNNGRVLLVKIFQAQGDMKGQVQARPPAERDTAVQELMQGPALAVLRDEIGRVLAREAVREGMP